MPLLGVLTRLVIYVVIGLLGVTVFRQAGAPVIAAAELSLTAEAIFLMIFLNKRLERQVRVFPAIGKGLLSALVSGAAAYGLAVFLPGPGYITALAGMAVGGALAVLLVWSEARLLFRL